VELPIRLLDVLGAALGLLLLSPLLLLVGLAVRLQDGGPALYRAVRVGRWGRHFRLLKFRTMVVDAAKRGPGITVARDPRITPLGIWLRRTKLDELPQLWNVLRGEMSLVGPRPEDPRYVALYTPEQREVLAYRPGITSPASLAFRQEESMLAGEDWEKRYCAEIMPAKLAMDLGYLRRRTLLSDLQVIAATLSAVFFDRMRRSRKRGAEVGGDP
jgi:lipopolysaccharide/colanic/teichoic acid biosynthesis glycosyltransferase